MKTFILQIIVAFLFISSGFAQSGCSKFYPFSEGATSQLSMYDKKGKISAIVEYTVTNVTSTGSGETAIMTQKLIDEKGNLLTTSEYGVMCQDGVVSMDFKSLSRPQMLEQFGDAETEITGTNIDLPNDLTVGQELPDGAVNIAVNMSGMTMNMNTSITDRKVVGKETVTTPAGSFDCYVITSTTTMKMGTNMTSKSKQWIAEGVGVVKMEDYNKNGKVRGSGLLTAFSK